MGQTSTLLALSGLIFLSCCGDTALKAAARDKAVIEATKALPDLPLDCRRHAQTGVKPGEGIDTASLKVRVALRIQTARTDRCAGWYDKLQTGFADKSNNRKGK